MEHLTAIGDTESFVSGQGLEIGNDRVIRAKVCLLIQPIRLSYGYSVHHHHTDRMKVFNESHVIFLFNCSDVQYY